MQRTKREWVRLLLLLFVFAALARADSDAWVATVASTAGHSISNIAKGSWERRQNVLAGTDVVVFTTAYDFTVTPGATSEWIQGISLPDTAANINRNEQSVACLCSIYVTCDSTFAWSGCKAKFDPSTDKVQVTSGFIADKQRTASVGLQCTYKRNAA